MSSDIPVTDYSSDPSEPFRILMPGSLRQNALMLSQTNPESEREFVETHLRQQIQLSNLISQINNEIRSTLELDEVLNSACRILCQVLQCSRANILVVDSATPDTLLIRGEFDQENYPTQLGTRVSISGDAYLYRLMQQAGALAIANFPEFPGLSERVKQVAQTLELRSVLAVSTRSQGQVNGIVELHQCDRERTWTAWEKQLLEAISNQLAIAINQARLYSETRRRAEHEALLRLITNQIRRTLDLGTILQTIASEVRQLLNTDRVVIYQFVDHWQGQVVVEDVAAPWRSILGEMGEDNCFSEEYAALYAGGRIRAIHNILEAGLDTCHVEYLESLQVKSNLIVPVLIGPQLWGLLLAHECRNFRVWQPWEMDLLQQLADQSAIAIQQAELHAQAETAAVQAKAQAQQLQQALNELQTTQMQLIQTEKLSSLGQMVAGIAHELNNAVTFIHANLPYAQQYAESLIQSLMLYQQHGVDVPDEVAQIHQELELEFVRQDFPKLLQSMNVGTARLTEFVRTLRNFARLDETAHKPVDLHEGLESSLVLLKHRLNMGVTLHKQFGPLPLVECHARQLNQVFLNLLNNALDAAGSHAVITIRTWQPDPNIVAVSIRDNGPGIPSEVQAKMFDPFFTTKPVGQGMGLGLSIAHQIIVKGHGGQIRCLTEAGQGTEFQVELPVIASVEETDEEVPLLNRS